MRVNFLRIACTVVTGLLLAACSQDDVTDGNALPEGQYPLEIASVAVSVEGSEQPWGDNAPQTRVAENTTDGNSSEWEWNGSEKIDVQLYADGETAVYTLNADKSLTPDKTLYWENTQQTNVTAWYPAYEGGSGTVSLADQSKKLAYVLAGTGTGSYNNPVTLNFTHALAKVRVVLQGDQADKVTDVKIKSYTSCTHTQGAVTTTGASEGLITMKSTTCTNGVKCWEANVVANHKITDFQVNGVSNKLNNDGITPLAAKLNTITLIVGNKEITGGGTIDKPGNYIIRGSITETVTLSGNDINLTLDNVSCNIGSPIKIENGTSTITLQGNSTLTASNAPAIWLIGEGANVIIKGTENSQLKVISTDGSAAIGTNFYINGGVLPCGNITIENASIEASSKNSAAAIGTGGGFYEKGTCGVITIINSDIQATVGDNNLEKPAVIGTGGTDGNSMYCAGINITLKDGQSKDDFLSKLTGSCFTKVGAGEGKNSASNKCEYVHWYNADGSLAD